MKRLVKSYTSFHKRERIGLVGLLAILALLIITRMSLSNFTTVKPDEIKRQQLSAKWQAVQQNKSSEKQVEREAGYYAKSTSAIDNELINNSSSLVLKPELFAFDPNTLDSAGFRKLGLKEKTTSNLLRWRAKGKVFKSKEELRAVYTLSEEEYLGLEHYIKIKQTSIDKKINLNTADSTTLVYLNGIGPRLAHRIIEYRKKNGPFLSYDQLYEVYRFPDSVFRRLQKESTLN